MVDSSIRQTFLDIASNDYAVPEDVDPASFLLDTLPLLGETDGEFRESYVYGTFHRWVVSDAVNEQGLREIHMALLGEDALFSGIGESGSDSVFLRAFAVLMLVPTLYVHRQQPFLSSEEMEQTCSCLSRYLLEETDLRGYVSPEKWWAHGIAHAADAVGQLVQCTELSPEQIGHLLEAVAHAIAPDTVVFAHEEDARMAAAVIRLLERDILTSEAVEDWLNVVVPEARFNGQLPNVHIRYVNARNFLRCLLFQAKKTELPDRLISLIEAAQDALPDR